MTNDTIQDLRREAESLARTINDCNRIRMTVYAWQDENVPLDEQEARLRKIVSMLRDGTAYRYTFTIRN